MGAALDAPTLRQAMARFHEALEAHREEIDSLNVFPVPDGDTGTNMLLTQRSVVEALGDEDLERRIARAPWFLSELGRRISRAALMGARGNSGVILSQMLRGFCDRYCVDLDHDEGERLDGRDLAGALTRADEEARSAVATPVEGTMVTVLGEAAEAAVRRARGTPDQAEVARAALDEARSSLERTPDRLPELRRAGVVDAGGKGVVLLLDALAGTIRGEGPSVEVGPPGPVGRRDTGRAPSTRYGYEVMYLVTAPGSQLASLRDRLSAMGDSLVVVGGGDLYQVHLHTDDPGAAIEEGMGLAQRVEGIRISSLDEAVAARCVATEGFREVHVGGDASEEAPSGAGAQTQSLVAVAEGAGFTRLYGSLGARVVTGGPGNNPSVRELVEAVDTAPGEVVFLLANHPNVVPAARAAANDAATRVEVVGTGSMAHGLAVAVAFVPDLGPDENRSSMLAAAAEACHGEVARAERPSSWKGGRIELGDWVGLSGGEVLAVADHPAGAAVALCRAISVPPEAAADPGPDGRPACNDLLSLYLGQDASDADGERMAEALEEAFPHLEVEIHRGDQPGYPYLIGIE